MRLLKAFLVFVGVRVGLGLIFLVFGLDSAFFNLVGLGASIWAAVAWYRSRAPQTATASAAPRERASQPTVRQSVRSDAPPVYTMEMIKHEWPNVVDKTAALAAWSRGRELYEGTDSRNTARMREAVKLLSEGLRVHLYEEEFIPALIGVERPDGSLVSTVWWVVWGSFCYRQLSAEDQRTMRLGLAVAKKYGYQHEAWGGDGSLSRIFELKAFHLDLYNVLLPGGPISDGNPADFFVPKTQRGNIVFSG